MRALRFVPLLSARRSAMQWITCAPAARAASTSRAMLRERSRAPCFASSGSCERSPITPRWISWVTSAVCAGLTSSRRSSGIGSLLPDRSLLRAAPRSRRRGAIARSRSTSSVCSPRPRQRRDRALGEPRQLHRIADHEVGPLRVGARHLDQHVARRDVRVARDVLGAGCSGPRRCRPRTARRAASSLVLSRAHASSAGRITVSVWRAQPSRSRSADRRATPGGRAGAQSRSNMVLAEHGDDEVAVARGEARRRAPIEPGPRHRRGRAHRPQERQHVGHRDHRVEHRDVDVLAEAGGVAMAQRREHADHARRARSRCRRARPRPRPAAAGPALRRLVEPAHRLGDRRVGGPARVRRGLEVAEARDRDVDERAGGASRSRRSRARARPSSRRGSSRRPRRSAARAGGTARARPRA